MRAPNPEQLLAIEHTGGVLLSAGAGSGKTFVIIEHLIYLIKNYINQEDDNIDAEWIARLEQYLDGIVVMTFTKKAASEIMLRFKSRVSGEFPDSSALHVAINQSVDHLFVGTIHGFCSKLLSGGYLPQATPQISITSEQEFKKKMTERSNFTATGGVKQAKKMIKKGLAGVPSPAFNVGLGEI